MHRLLQYHLPIVDEVAAADGGAGVVDQIARRILLIGQEPIDAVGAAGRFAEVLLRQHLIDRRPVQVREEGHRRRERAT